jgi:opacity protein-like surface antigen
MKLFKNSSSFGALLAASVIFSPNLANATDIFDKRNDAFADPAPVQGTAVGGFYIRGDLGIAQGDRTTERTITRDLNGELTVDPLVWGPTAPDDVADALNDANVPFSRDGNNFLIPLIADQLGYGDDQSWDSMVFGGELAYLYAIPNSRFGVEIAAGATFYDEDDSTTSTGHMNAAGRYLGGTAASDFVAGASTCADFGTCAGDPSHFTQSGFASVHRDYDIDLLLRGHLFAAPNLSIYVGAGPSWARANIAGVNAPDIGQIPAPIDGFYPTAFNDTESSLGYVLNAGLLFWATDRITIGVDYTYKNHDFDTSASNSGSFNAIPDVLSLSGGANDRVSVEDEVHAIKARLGFKLN